MALELDFSNIGDPTKIHEGGGRPKPGRGMALIKNWSEYTGARGKAHELELEIVAWTDKDSVGQTHTENIFHEDKSGKGFPMRRMICLGMAAGLFNAHDVEEWKKHGMQNVDFHLLVGRPVMVVLIEEPDKEDKSKTYIRVGEIGLGIYHIADPKTKDWPKNQGLVNRHLPEVGQWIESTQASGNQPAAPAANAGANPFEGKV